jgi:serine phosphatase RsbU (regulator of sigma subunit)
VLLGGHPSALHVTAAGDITAVGGRGPMLGLVDSWVGASEAVTLAPGDTILLYSDGVTESRRGRELFGEGRLRDVVRASARSEVGALVTAIDRAVADFTSELSDDLAILAVRLD